MSSICPFDPFRSFPPSLYFCTFVSLLVFFFRCLPSDYNLSVCLSSFQTRLSDILPLAYVVLVLHEYKWQWAKTIVSSSTTLRLIEQLRLTVQQTFFIILNISVIPMFASTSFLFLLSPLKGTTSTFCCNIILKEARREDGLPRSRTSSTITPSTWNIATL